MTKDVITERLKFPHAQALPGHVVGYGSTAPESCVPRQSLGTNEIVNF